MVHHPATLSSRKPRSTYQATFTLIFGFPQVTRFRSLSQGIQTSERAECSRTFVQSLLHFTTHKVGILFKTAWPNSIQADSPGVGARYRFSDVGWVRSSLLVSTKALIELSAVLTMYKRPPRKRAKVRQHLRSKKTT